MSKPELIAPPEIYYGLEEARKYVQNRHIIGVQSLLSQRAHELLLLPHDNCLLLDLGCGCGNSSKALQKFGHVIVGVDISKHMLAAGLENDVENAEFILADMGQALKFRQNVFDGAISISAIQWLCAAYDKLQEPYRRLLTFFSWLYDALKVGSRAIFQYYTESVTQVEMITSAAMRCGFGGGVLVDFPNSTKAKKQYLCLWTGFCGLNLPKFPVGLGVNDVLEVGDSQIRDSKRKKMKGLKKGMSRLQWVLHKKGVQRAQGRNVRPDTKYTARKRKDRF